MMERDFPIASVFYHSLKHSENLLTQCFYNNNIVKETGESSVHEEKKKKSQNANKTQLYMGDKPL